MGSSGVKTSASLHDAGALNSSYENREGGVLVSVVVPTHNRSGLLVRALRSIQRQTHTNLEIIVVDDASNDDTALVVQRIGDSRIRYLRHNVCRGGSAARNTGIRAAAGEYIAFLDDDDEWVPEKIAEQLKAVGDADAVLCTASMNGCRCGPVGSRHRIEPDDLRRGRYTGGGTGILLARSSVLKETGFDECLPRCQDWDLFIRLVQRYTIAYLDKPLLTYNEGGHARISNEIVGMSSSELNKRLQILEKHREFFGARWVKFHRAGFLLYGIRHRRDRWRHLARTISECGVIPVARALSIRVRQMSRQYNFFGILRLWNYPKSAQ